MALYTVPALAIICGVLSVICLWRAVRHKTSYEDRFLWLQLAILAAVACGLFFYSYSKVLEIYTPI